MYLTRSGMPSQSVRQKFSSFRVGGESGVIQWILKKWIWRYGLDVPGWGQGRLAAFVKTIMNLPVLYIREACSSESDWIFTRILNIDLFVAYYRLCGAMVGTECMGNLESGIIQNVYCSCLLFLFMSRTVWTAMAYCLATLSADSPFSIFSVNSFN